MANPPEPARRGRVDRRILEDVPHFAKPEAAKIGQKWRFLGLST